MYICACVVCACQLLSELYPMEPAPFKLGLSYEVLYWPFETLRCAWLDFLMTFTPSIVQILELWTNFLLASCEQRIAFLIIFSYWWILQWLVKIQLFLDHRIVPYLV